MSIVDGSEQLGQKFGFLSVHAVLSHGVASFSEWRYKRKLNSFVNSEGDSCSSGFPTNV